MSREPPITIKYEQSLAYAGSEHWQQGRTVFVQLFDSMVNSGLLARLTGNALKVLSALGLAASPLGGGSEKDEAFFQDLVAADIVAPQDRGKLFCCVPHDELVRRIGISKNTLSRCTAELEGHGMVEKRAVRKADGTRYNIFFTRRHPIWTSTTPTVLGLGALSRSLSQELGQSQKLGRILDLLQQRLLLLSPPMFRRAKALTVRPCWPTLLSARA